MANRADTLSGNGFQLSGSKKKKKKKKNLGEHDGEKSDQCVTPPLPSPFDRSSFFSEPVEYQGAGDGEAPGKKTKKNKREKKASRERFDSQSDRFSVVAESELNSDAGTPTCRKKRKQKRKPSEHDADDLLYVPETPEGAINPPEGDHLENVAHVYESTPLKKKKKHASAFLAERAEARQASVRDTNDRTDSMRPSKQDQMELSETVDTEMDTFASLTPSWKTQHSDHSPKKENANLSHSDAGKKPRKHKQSQRTNDSDSTGNGLAVEETVSLDLKSGQGSKLAHLYEKTPLKKKKKPASACLAERASIRDTNGRTDSLTPGKQNRTDFSKTVDTEEDIVVSFTPSQKMQCSDLSPEKENANLSLPNAGKKPQKHKKSHRTGDLDAASDGLAVQETVSLDLKSGQGSKLSHDNKSTSLKKKKKHASIRDTNDRTDSASPSEQDQRDLSETVDTEEDIVASLTPSRKTHHSGLPQVKGKRVAKADLSFPDAGQKPRKQKKSHRTGDLDAAGDGLEIEETVSLGLKSGQGSKLSHDNKSASLKKKKKHASIRDTNDRTDSVSPSEQDQRDLSETVDTEEDIVASLTPSRKTHHSGLPQVKGKRVAKADLSFPDAGQKPRKQKKSHRTGDLDAAGDGLAIEETVSLGLKSGQGSKLSHDNKSASLKKKKKHASIRDTNDRTDSASPSEQDQRDLSETVDTEEDIVASLTPSRKTHHSGLPQVKGKRVAKADLSFPDAGQKPRKQKKSHRTGDLDAAGDGLAIEETVSLGLKSGQGSKLSHDNKSASLKKKKKHASIRDTNDRTDSASPSEQDQRDLSETVDTEEDIVASLTPSRKTHHSGLPQVKGKRVAKADLSFPDAGQKPRKQKKSHRTGDLDASGDGLAIEETVSLGLKSGQGSKRSHDNKSTSLKKKKKHASIRDTNDRTDSASPRERDQRDLSETVDSEEEIVTSLTPSRKMHHSGLSLVKGKRVAKADLSRPDVGKKPWKRKKSHRTNDSDAAGDGLAIDKTVSLDLKSRRWCKLAASKGTNRLRNSRLPVHADAQGSASTGHPASETSSLSDNELLESFRSAYADLETVTRELEEFIPHVRSLSEGSIRKLACRDLDRFKEFKKQGIAVKFGRFTQKENDLLKRNMKEFLIVSGVESAEKLLFPHRFPKEKDALNKLKRELSFGLTLAEGLPRPWRLVYYRAKKMFDPQNYNGRYSEKEKKQLQAYQAIHGNNWKKISQLMSRSSLSVAWKYSQLKCQPNFGPWSEEENKKLVEAVEAVVRAKARGLDSAQEKEDPDQVLTVVRENLYQGIPWSEVEAKVETRHWRQCKQRWNLILNKRMSMGQTKLCCRENVKLRINLIERLHKLSVEDDKEIDWEDLSDDMGDFTPTYVQSRFYKLKTQYVPFWRKKNFSEIIDYLYEETLPKLKSVFEKKTAKETAAAEEPKQKKVFRFSDIFQNDSEEDED